MDVNTKAAEMKKAYRREWAKKHPEKNKEYQERYWNKKAEQALSNSTDEPNN